MRKGKKRQNERKMRNMKCTTQLLVSFFILAIILIIAVPSTGFAAKTTVTRKG